MSKTDALTLAKQFVVDYSTWAQVTIQLRANGWPQLANLIAQAVIVSTELLRLDEQCAALLADKQAEILRIRSNVAKYCGSEFCSIYLE